MKSESNKAINRVTKRLLKPMGFIRWNDRYWLYDGGWWLARLNFDPSGWSKGSYGSVGIQCLLTGSTGWISDGVDSPRLWVDLGEDEGRFEAAFEDMVRQLLPIALDLVNRIHGPQDFLDQLDWRKKRSHPEFYKGMLCGLAQNVDGAKEIFTAVTEQPCEHDHHRADQQSSKVALSLLSQPEAFADFADSIIYRTRVIENLPGLGPNSPAFPWRVPVG